MRAFTSHPYGLSLIPAWCHMWVEFVGGSCLTPNVFLWVLRFSSLHKKTQHLQIPIQPVYRTRMKTSQGCCGFLSKNCKFCLVGGITVLHVLKPLHDKNLKFHEI